MANDPVTATYRLQLHAGFQFDDARRIVPYLHALGISHLYLSPIARARRGSTHGYDVVDPTRISEALGGQQGYAALVAACRAQGMGVVLDIVPNHMAAHEENPWWRDVLLRGEESQFAGYFDIHWGEADGRLFLPVLGKPLEALAPAELSVVQGDAGLEIAYYDRRFPLRPDTERLLDGNSTFSDIQDALASQHYVLGFWGDAAERVNYRRFFDINDLVGVRVERPEVFTATHALLGQLADADLVDGVRVDHVDGLRDPASYLQQLRDLLGDRPIWVEKILDRDELLPASWPVEGTTGYEFLGVIDRLLFDTAGLADLHRWYADFAPDVEAFPDIVRACKEEVLSEHFGAEFDHLASAAGRLLETPEPQRVHEALRELTIALPRYRTYGTADGLSDEDGELIGAAASEAVARGVPPGPVGDVAELLCTPMAEPARAELLLRWQQLTGPIAAKGVEDTAMYRDNRLLSVNEVGRSPREDAPGLTVDEFHAMMQVRREQNPRALNATSTHDTKRSEDVRWRLDVLTEIVPEWTATVERWRQLNAPHVRQAGSLRVPVANAESGLYQAIVGVWENSPPDRQFVDRIVAYAIKAARERSLRTSWVDIDGTYEQALEAWVRAILGPDGSPEFLSEVAALSGRLAWFGALNGLSATLLKATCPGIPDTYQGAETQVLALVDPDNRRPVDFASRDAALAGQRQAGSERDWGAALRDGSARQALLAGALTLRRRYPDVFLHGSYDPLPVAGSHANAVIAFQRRHPTGSITVVAPRHWTRLTGPGELPGSQAWADTSIILGGESQWEDALTGEVLPVRNPTRLADLLTKSPVALLIHQPGRGLIAAERQSR